MPEHFENQFLELIAICKIRKAEGFRILHAKRTELFHVQKDVVSKFMCWILFAVEEQQPLWPGGSQAAAHFRRISAQSGGNHP